MFYDGTTVYSYQLIERHGSKTKYMFNYPVYVLNCLHSIFYKLISTIGGNIINYEHLHTLYTIIIVTDIGCCDVRKRPISAVIRENPQQNGPNKRRPIFQYLVHVIVPTYFRSLKPLYPQATIFISVVTNLVR